MFKVTTTGLSGPNWVNAEISDLARLPGMTLATAELCAALAPGGSLEYGPAENRVRVECDRHAGRGRDGGTQRYGSLPSR